MKALFRDVQTPRSLVEEERLERNELCEVGQFCPNKSIRLGLKNIQKNVVHTPVRSLRNGQPQLSKAPGTTLQNPGVFQNWKVNRVVGPEEIQEFVASLRISPRLQGETSEISLCPEVASFGSLSAVIHP